MNVDDLRAEWPALVWTDGDPADSSTRGRVVGSTRGGAIVVGRDFVEVYVQGIPGPAKLHNGTIADIRRAVRAAIEQVDDVLALLDPSRTAERQRTHALANEVQGLRGLVDEVDDTLCAVDDTNALSTVANAATLIREYRAPVRR